NLGDDGPVLLGRARRVFELLPQQLQPLQLGVHVGSGHPSSIDESKRASSRKSASVSQRRKKPHVGPARGARRTCDGRALSAYVRLTTTRLMSSHGSLNASRSAVMAS